MNNKRIITLTLCWILVTFSGICVLAFADNQSESNTQAEQHFQKANELHIIADYDAAITEYEAVIQLLPNSKIAWNAQYWIGQLYFESGQFDAALSGFQKLLDKYPESTIIPKAKLMIERVQQAKKSESLFLAIKENDIERVKLLISQGADVNVKIKDQQGWPNLNTPLLFAAYEGHFEIVKVLLDSGADVNMEDPLSLAVLQNHKDIVELLVDNGAKISENMIYTAAFNGYRDIAEYFLSKVDVTSSLHMAAFAGDLSKVQEFIEQGTEVDRRGIGPLSLAALDGQRSLGPQDFREYAVFQNKGQGGGTILAWRDDVLSYVLIGNVEMSQLMNMAQSISAGK